MRFLTALEMTLPRNDEREEWSDGFAVRSLLLLLPQFAVIPNAAQWSEGTSTALNNHRIDMIIFSNTHPVRDESSVEKMTPHTPRIPSGMRKNCMMLHT